MQDAVVKPCILPCSHRESTREDDSENGARSSNTSKMIFVSQSIFITRQPFLSNGVLAYIGWQPFQNTAQGIDGAFLWGNDLRDWSPIFRNPNIFLVDHCQILVYIGLKVGYGYEHGRSSSFCVLIGSTDSFSRPALHKRPLSTKVLSVCLSLHICTALSSPFNPRRSTTTPVVCLLDRYSASMQIWATSFDQRFLMILPYFSGAPAFHAFIAARRSLKRPSTPSSVGW